MNNKKKNQKKSNDIDTLIDAIGNINDDIISSALNVHNKKRAFPFKKAFSIAASFALICIVGIASITKLNYFPNEDDKHMEGVIEDVSSSDKTSSESVNDNDIGFSESLENFSDMFEGDSDNQIFSEMPSNDVFSENIPETDLSYEQDISSESPFYSEETPPGVPSYPEESPSETPSYPTEIPSETPSYPEETPPEAPSYPVETPSESPSYPTETPSESPSYPEETSGEFESSSDFTSYPFEDSSDYWESLPDCSMEWSCEDSSEVYEGSEEDLIESSEESIEESIEVSIEPPIEESCDESIEQPIEDSIDHMFDESIEQFDTEVYYESINLQQSNSSKYDIYNSESHHNSFSQDNENNFQSTQSKTFCIKPKRYSL